MTQSNFESFVIHNANEQAARVCRAVAELDCTSAQPIVIYGERGSGKTHLLYTTVNHARARSINAGLYGITPKYFPDKVRAIIADSSPVRTGGKAILVVDDLESITDVANELEAVVRIFVENGQSVILCSSIHPNELRNVTPGFRAIIANGLIVRIQARAGAGSGDSNCTQARIEGEDQIPLQATIIRRLRNALQKVKGWGAARATVEPEPGERPGAQPIRNETLGAAIADTPEPKRREGVEAGSPPLQMESRIPGGGRPAPEGATAVQNDLERALADQTALQAEIESLKAQAARESEQARLRYAETMAIFQRKSRQLEEMNKALESERTALTESVQQLRDQLEASRMQNAQVREEVNAAVYRTEALLSAVATEHERFAQLKKEYNKRLREIEALRQSQEQSAGEAETVILVAALDSTRETEKPLWAKFETAPSDENVPASGFDESGRKRRIGEILRASGHITQEQLMDALKKQQEARRRKLGAILVENGYTSDEAVAETVAVQLGLPYVRLGSQPVSSSIVRLCSRKLARMHRCMPIRATGNELTLAMCDPLDLVAIDDVERVTHLRVNVVVAPTTDIEKAHEQYYAA
jgi:hypothetical protein